MRKIKPMLINTFNRQGCNQMQFILVIENSNYSSPIIITQISVTIIMMIICNWNSKRTVTVTWRSYN